MKEVEVVLAQRVADTGTATTIGYLVDVGDYEEPFNRIQLLHSPNEVSYGKAIARVKFTHPRIMWGTEQELWRDMEVAALREGERSGVLKREYFNEYLPDQIVPA